MLSSHNPLNQIELHEFVTVLLFMFQLLLQLCSELSLIYQLTDNKSNCPVLGKRAGQNFHNCSIKYRANVCLFIYSKFSSLYLSKDYNSSFGNGIMMSVHIQVSRLPQTPAYSSPGRPSTCYKNISRYRTAHLDIRIQWFHEFVCDFLVKLLNYTKQFIHYITYIFLWHLQNWPTEISCFFQTIYKIW